METMQKTLDLSLEMNTIAWNAYAVMPLPGSKVYKDAVEAGFKLPEDYAGYSFHAYTTQPLPTDELTPEQILKFRDDAYLKYHTNPKFLEKVRNTLINIEKLSFGYLLPLYSSSLINLP